MDGVELLGKNNPIYARKYKDAVYYDCGNKAEYIKAVIAYAMKRDDLKNGLLEYMKSLS